MVEIEENGHIFAIFRKSKRSSENNTSYTIDVANATCDCGEWQDHGVPCIDGMAYFRFRARISLQEVYSQHVDKHYTYEHEQELLRKNIVLVCIESIAQDGNTLPPAPSKRKVLAVQRNNESENGHDGHTSQRNQTLCVADVISVDTM